VTEQTKELRRTGLGGSDMAAVMGLNPYKSAYELWAEKSGLIDPPDLSDDDLIWFGQQSEELHAKYFARRMGLQLGVVEETVRHPQMPFLMAHPDRFIVGESAGLELKTTDSFGLKREWGEEMTDEIPQHYLPQVHQYMLLQDWDRMYVSVLVDRDVHVYLVRRNKHWDGAIEEAAHVFWNDYVLPGVAPDMRYDRVTLGALKRVYSNVQPMTGVIANKRIEALATLKWSTAERVKELNLQSDAIDAELRHYMQDCEFLILPGDHGHVLKKIKVEGGLVPAYQREPYTYLRRVKTPKLLPMIGQVSEPKETDDE